VPTLIARRASRGGGAPRRRWLGIASVGVLLGACGASSVPFGEGWGPTRTPTPDPNEVLPTALQALAIAVPELRPRHSGGVVLSLAADQDGGRIRQWVVDIWAPDRGRSYHYPVVAGTLHGAVASSTVGPGGLAYIMTLADERPPEDLVDSDRALALADAAGAEVFKREGSAELRTISLSGRLDGSLRWRLFFSRLKSGNVTLSVEIDARSGAITQYVDGRLTPIATRRP
jgi:hypothetical protein